MSRTATLAASLVLFAACALSGCSNSGKPATSGSTMPPDVAAEFNRRMQQQGTGGGGTTAPTAGAQTNPGYPAGVPTGPGR